MRWLLHLNHILPLARYAHVIKQSFLRRKLCTDMGDLTRAQNNGERQEQLYSGGPCDETVFVFGYFEPFSASSLQIYDLKTAQQMYTFHCFDAKLSHYASTPGQTNTAKPS